MNAIPDGPISPAKRILCVDDDPSIREVLAQFLRRRGHVVETAPDGLAAARVVAENPLRFDAVITDNQMPHLSGIELVERLRRSAYHGKILFFSSTLSPQNRERLTHLRVDAVLEKGQPVTDLIGALERAVSE